MYNQTMSLAAVTGVEMDVTNVLMDVVGGFFL